MAKAFGGKRPQNLRHTLRRFGDYLGHHKRKLALIGVLTSISALAALIGTYMIRPAVNGILENGSLAYLARVVALTSLAYHIGALATLGYTQLMVRTAQRITQEIRSDLFAHLQTMPLNFFDTNRKGDLMSLFTNDLDTVQECYGCGFMQFFDPIILCSLAITRMWRMDHLLTVLSLIPMGLLFASAAVVGKNMTRKWDSRQKCFSDLSDFAQESFSGIAVIKAFVKEAKELMAFEKLNRDSEDSNIAFTKTSVLMRILVTTFVESVICVILGYGGYLVYKGQFNAGQLMEFIGYFNAVVWPIMAVADLIDMTSRGKASLKRISELLDAPKNVFDRPGVQELTDPRGEIEFRDLSFTYPAGDIPAVEHVAFTIRPGESIGLVGKTGSGKTTLVDLILRTYNVNDGQLFLDGRDVNDLSIRSVRDACAYVPQDNFLY